MFVRSWDWDVVPAVAIRDFPGVAVGTVADLELPPILTAGYPAVSS
jgi:hypothetical protein